MNKKSGKAGTTVEPIAPNVPHEADVADPGEVESIKAEQIKTKSGKYGSAKLQPHKPDSNAGGGTQRDSDGEEENKLSWIEIELVGEDDKPIPGEKYRVSLPNGSVDEGTLDQEGRARVEGFEEGTCKITFPDLDEKAWEAY